MKHPRCQVDCALNSWWVRPSRAAPGVRTAVVAPGRHRGDRLCEMLHAMPPSPDVIVAIGQLLQPLLDTLERVIWVQRHFFPPFAPRLAEELAPCAEAV